ncbi:hypothetical protein [Mucilaginibacter terrae]|uniref:GAPS4 PD-(D/E)XK nuclease domain-containing protein n=1 Tax=Mucilaginibacter terrae TaxID=1955052 RepID=A0ABU3GN77_9SPHI|nr:hypothetical protein [Mucilaginibacter terrae]MDT3401221.1 hypothetical protein [Mucilaginibacter terrae]
MAEDQGVNGDYWNDQATALLTQFNWQKLGDSNIDLPNEEKGKSGVDSLFTYVDSLRKPFTEAVIVEAKRYKTDSFTSSSLQTWITILDRKLTNLKNSEELQEKFPVLKDIPLRTGLIVIWFHNFKEYHNFRSTFETYLAGVKVSRKNQSSNKIYVLENDAILRLASLHMSIKELDTESGGKFQFYYPSVDLHPAKRSRTLNLNYMLSKFILGDFADKNGTENKVVFYFGSLNIESFQRLKHALVTFSYLDDDKPLIIYTYLRDDEEFRKVRPDVIKLFKDHLELREMEILGDLPKFMRS